MRLGISSSLGYIPPAKWAAKLVELGCKSVVFPVDCNADEALIDEYVAEAKKNDLLIAEVGIWRNALTLDPEERTRNLEYSIRQLRLAERYFFSNVFLEHTFDLLSDRIVSCHLKDIKLLEGYTFQLKECACGEGTFNIKRYMELASSIDPDMPMIIEHLPDDAAYEISTKYILSL